MEIFILWLLVAASSAVSPMETLENPVAFERFEHNELSKETFINETRVIRDLKAIRHLLETRKKMIRDFIQSVRGRNLSQSETRVHDSVTAFSMIKRLSVKAPRISSEFKKDYDQWKFTLDSVKVATTDFPEKKDFFGAVKGLVTLHDTYLFDLPATAEGRVHYLSNSWEEKDFHGREKLFPDDMALIAEKAKTQMIFDTSIDFIRTAFAIIDKAKPSNATLKKLETLRKQLVHLNNQHLLKWGVMIGPNYKVTPFLLDKDLSLKPNQPKDLMASVRKIEIKNDFQQEFCFRSVCKSDSFTRLPVTRNLPKCGFLHHFNPYLRLGPFKVEVIERSPYLSILHGIFSEEEIKWMIDFSVPRLSRLRDNNKIPAAPKYESRDKKKRKSVYKTVQCWIKEIEYDKYNEVSDPMNYTIHYPVMFKLAKKLELATQMNITGKYSSTEFQTTNYGLGGLCEKHLDPHGYIEGAESKGQHATLVQSGDMLGTIMGWLGEVEGGGGTAFFHQKVEKTLMPTRGSAAFWYDLDRKGHRDQRTLHGGCPVIKGSKWIINKWIYYFNQNKKFSCGLKPNEFFPPPSGYYKNYSPGHQR